MFVTETVISCVLVFTPSLEVTIAEYEDLVS